MSGLVRLVGTELSRLRSRRLTVVTALVLVAVMGLFQLVVHDLASPPSATERAQGQQAYEQAQQSWQADQAGYLASCTASGEPQAQCEADYPPPTLSDFLQPATPFDQLGKAVTSTAAYLAMLAAFLVAASFVGAEYTTGSLANWLTFVPRRLLVYGSKVGAVLIGSALLGAVVAFTLAGLAAAQVAAYGLPLSGAGHVAAASGRVVVLAAVAGLVGFALALLTRHTVAALGCALGYAIVGTVVRGLTYDGNGPLAWLPPYLPDLNLTAFLERGATYTQYVNEVTAEGITQRELERHISFGHSGVYWLVVVLVAVVPSLLVFQRRDVT